MADDDKTLEHFDPYEDTRQAAQHQAAQQQWFESLDYDQQEAVKQQGLQTAAALSRAWDNSLKSEKMKASEVSAFVQANPHVNQALASGELSPRQVAKLAKEARGGGRAPQPGQPKRPAPDEKRLNEVRGRLNSGRPLSDREREQAINDLLTEKIRGM